MLCFIIRLCFYQILIISDTFLLISIFSLFNILRNTENNADINWRFIRKMSTVTYFTHLYVWTVCYSLIYGKKTYGFEIFVITTLITFVLSIIISYLTEIKKCKYFKKFILTKYTLFCLNFSLFIHNIVNKDKNKFQ